MTRIVKKPEVRKNEILDAARKFFFQKGYKQTTIQDIMICSTSWLIEQQAKYQNR